MSGKQARRRLRKSADRTLDRLEEVRDDLRSCMSDWVEETSEVVASSIATGKEKAKEGSDYVVRTLDKVRDCMEDGRERVEKYIRSVAS
jgi:gas vesicle protein